MLVGAHLDNVDTPPDSSYRRLTLMRAEVVVCLWTAGTRHRKPVYERLKGLGVQRVCIRVGDEWVAGLVDDYLLEVDAAVANAVAGGFAESAIDVQILNEVNLRTDAETAGWLVGEVVRKWRRQARPVLTPLSRGVDGWREYLAAFVHAMGELPGDHACGVHAYAGDAEQIEPTGGKAMVITEFGHADIGGRARGLWVVERLKEFARKGYGYACQFIVDGQDPTNAWPDSYVMTDAEAIAIGERGPLPEPEQEATTVTIRGIDISNNNGHVDLKRVRDEWHGQFVVIKVSEDDWGDDDFFDSYAAENLAKARELEMGVGIYSFLRPSKSSPAESVTVIQRALAKLGGLREGEFVALDVEDENFTGDLHVWLAEALALGSQVFDHLVWKYSADWYTSTRNLEHPDLEPNPTWWASYQSARPEPQVGWGPIRMWQYDVTEAGVVPGVAGQCDVDVFYGTLDELRALGKQGNPAPIPAPKPDRVAALIAGLRANLDELEQAIKETA